ncbi:MAG TPA: SidA/IucD/PvdA family monooxygenase [Longimicrobium sp.]|nr:SidA/IucD/PvdA family monooxygenase [Longimicrobium sp.]
MREAPATRADLVVLGAGPKAAAIAAKAHVLNELGYGPLRVVILEQHEVAASWTGRHGFTTGAERLGTRPEKDVGFPYQSSRRFGPGGSEIDAAMLQFSWQSHLVQLGEYRRWVDGGVQCPNHRDVARYFSWVISRATSGVELRIAKVTGIGLRADGWVLHAETRDGGRECTIAGRGLALTGPGKPRALPCTPDISHRVISPAMTVAELEAAQISPRGRICIVGSGESAITLALLLIERGGDDIDLTFVTPSLPYSRAESFLENAVYSDPSLIDWHELPEADRLEFIRRSDRGVMSPAALEQLSRHRHLTFLVGRVRRVEPAPGGRACVVVARARETVRREFDLVANCTGSCALRGLTDLLGETTAAVERRLGVALTDEAALRGALDGTFALHGLTPRLHVPALAGLAHGPGFANLSCLGSLGDHILSAYVELPLSPDHASAPGAGQRIPAPAVYEHPAPALP